MTFIRKLFVLMAFTLLVCFVVSNYYSVQAASSIPFTGQMNVGQEGIESTKSLLSSILGIVRIIGMTVAVVMLAVIACKYMLSAPGDRADLKKYLPVYITGAIVLFGASGLVGLIRDITMEATGK